MSRRMSATNSTDYTGKTKLLADPERKKKLSASVDRDLDRRIFEGVPGVKVDPKNLCHVRFEAGTP